MKKVKFMIVYAVSLLVGNGVLFTVNLIGSSKGNEPWTLINYIVSNIVIVLLGIIAGKLSENDKFNKFFEED